MNVSRDLSHTSSVKVLTDLLARLEAAEGPDRELDADLYWVLDHAKAERLFNVGALGLPREYPATLPIPGGLGRAGLRASGPNFTASLDASLALLKRVLPAEVGVVSFGGMWSRADFIDAGGVKLHATCRTPALALLCALVKALIARDFAGSDTSRANVTDPGRTKKQPEVKP